LSRTGPKITGGTLVLGLGDHGVHAEVGPLHGDVGDLLSAQNASFFSGEGQRGGLHKRMGLEKLSATALAGEVYAIFPVTFADPSPGGTLTDSTPEDLTDETPAVLTE
jgi:hypothetical protein